ncbi:TDT family transporter [Kitasatospora sp. NPDC051914]|uniref:SLAC1 family transporter n=1 Tax=Kitasatospora sp. NPDC051914 TaxID=3154945 RepID=UPI00342CC6D4
MLTPNLFGICFGLAALAGTWHQAAALGSAPAVVGDAVLALAAAVWLVLLIGYPAQVARRPGGWRAEFHDRGLGPFVSLAPITGMLLAVGLHRHAPGAADWLFGVCAAATAVAALALTGQWQYGELEPDTFHPGYLLPTVAGGLVAAQGLAELGWPGPAAAAFGVGAVSWVLLAPPLLARMLFRPPLHPMLFPTTAIEAAPPAVAGSAYLVMTGGRFDVLSWSLLGCTVLAVLVQARMFGAYRAAPFGPPWWSVTFTSSAVAGLALRWLFGFRPAGFREYSYLVLAAASLLVGAVAAATVVALCRGSFLMRPAEAATGV